MVGQLPKLRASKNACDSPHLVIVGAGASRAACPSGDANGRPLPLMVDLVETVGIRQLLEAANVPCAEVNFEDLYQALAKDKRHADLVDQIEGRVREYFRTIRIPPTVTLYDRLLLSLRPKDFIATFNWDPLLVQAFIRNRHLGELPQILFLHGNVDVGICHEHYCKGFLEHRCNVCNKPLAPTKLLYPIAEKDYTSDPFIAEEWGLFQDAIQEAYLLTIYGYAAPATDVGAVAAMKQAWESNGSRELANIDIVDIKSREELEATWKPFFVRSHYAIWDAPYGIFNHARRSCDHFAMATLQQRPCRDIVLPNTNQLGDLQEWAQTLISQEIALRERGEPLPC